MFQQTIKNFSINLNSLNETHSISSGDLLSGHISFELTKQTKITSITMVLTAKAHVHWSTRSGKTTRHYSAKQEFLEIRSVILHENSVTGEPTELAPGGHMYPFAYPLPLGDFPSSFQGVHGRITYALNVSIHRPWHLSKDFTTQLNFVHRINYNQPELWAPLSGSNEKTLCCLWCASGPVSMTVTTEKKAFTPGETVKISCSFSNCSSRTVTPRAKLVQREVCYTLNKASHRMSLKELAVKTGLHVDGHTTEVQHMILITVPETASPSISNCRILELDYFIKVSLRIPHTPNLQVLIPIIVCDAYVSTQPPSYS